MAGLFGYEARGYYQQALQIQQAIGDQDGLLNTYLNIGALHLKTEAYYEAISAFEKSLQISQEVDNLYQGNRIKIEDGGYWEQREEAPHEQRRSDQPNR